jgi:hypothetical protein
MGQKITITEQERQHILEMGELYKKNPFYTAKSFDMGNMKFGDYQIDERAQKYTDELMSSFEQIAKKEGRLVVKKTLENLLELYKNRKEE